MSLAHKDDYFETPDWLFNNIVNETGLEFDLDMCASEENTKCLNYINEETDALKFSGDNKVIFCNPPRSKNGKFVNKGVSGKKKIQEYRTWDKRKVASPFQYKTKGPPIDIISKWIKKRGIKPKGLGKGRSKETGQYLSGFAYLISKKIKRDGIKSLGFFQRPLGLGMKDFGKDLLKAVKKDVTDSLSKTQVN